MAKQNNALDQELTAEEEAAAEPLFPGTWLAGGCLAPARWKPLASRSWADASKAAACAGESPSAPASTTSAPYTSASLVSGKPFGTRPQSNVTN